MLFLAVFLERRPLRNFRRIWDDRPADTGCCRREMICVARAKAVFCYWRSIRRLRFWSFDLSVFPVSVLSAYFIFLAFISSFALSLGLFFPFLSFLCFPFFFFFFVFSLFSSSFPLSSVSSFFLCFSSLFSLFFSFRCFFLFSLFSRGLLDVLAFLPFHLSLPRPFLKFLLSCSFFFSFRGFIFTFSFVAFHLSPSRPFGMSFFLVLFPSLPRFFCVLFFLSPFVPPLSSRILLFSLSDLSCLPFFCSFSFGLFLFSPLFLASAFFPFFLPFFEVWRGG